MKSIIIIVGLIIAIGAGLVIAPYISRTPTPKISSDITRTLDEETNGPVKLDIAEPLNGEIRDNASLTIKGKTIPGAQVLVNEKEATASAQGNFSLSYHLDEGENYLLIIASDDKGNYAEKEMVTILQSPESPLDARVTGKITARSSDALAIFSEKDNTSYKVNISPETNLLRRFGGKAEMDEFSVGDDVSLVGRWKNENHSEVNVAIVRNLSVKKRIGIFFGEITGTLDNTLKITTLKRGQQVVVIDPETKIVNRLGEPLGQWDFFIGQKVSVKGLWDRTKGEITQVTEIKNFSLPLK